MRRGYTTDPTGTTKVIKVYWKWTHANKFEQWHESINSLKIQI